MKKTLLIILLMIILIFLDQLLKQEIINIQKDITINRFLKINYVQNSGRSI